MGLMLRPVILLFASLLAFPAVLPAAEVTNLKTDFTKSRMILEFDLAGTRGEQGYGIEVAMIINGTTYTSNMLTLSGDFGRMVPLGTSHKITWIHREDFPEGLDTKFKCVVNAVPESKLINEAAKPANGLRASYYALNRQTVTDTRTNLMWIRNANLSKKPIAYTDSKKYIEQLNRERFAGYNDWRIPSKEDLEGLIFFGKQAGWGDRLAHFIADYLMTCGFTNVQPGNYWTSTSADSSGRIMVANTWNGILRPLENTNYYYIWPVRDAAVVPIKQ
jgi:hypothetical protein